MQGSWRVVYKDGTELCQYKGAEEVPYRDIRWSDVRVLWLESQEIQEAFEIVDPPAGLTLSLRSRHFRTLANGELMCFMLVLAKEGVEVSDESVDSVFYWFPNGVGHACRLFNCSDVATFANQKLHHLELYDDTAIVNPVARLMPVHGTIELEASALLT